MRSQRNRSFCARWLGRIRGCGRAVAVAVAAVGVAGAVGAAGAGCRSIEYVSASGERLRITTHLYDTKIGRLIVRRADGTAMELENYDSQQQLTAALLELARVRPLLP